MLRNSLLNIPHEILHPTLSSHSLGQLIKSLMMGYGSKTQLALKLALIDFQGSLEVVFPTLIGCLFSTRVLVSIHILAKN